MRRWFLLAATVFDLALPGYRYQFPRDHFSHPTFQTEWWYYTGNLKTPAGRRFGFELTFFRKAVARLERISSAWDVADLYLAHLALSDIDGQRFYNTERLNRSGPGLAGASFEEQRVWNGNWQVRWTGEHQTLQAVSEDFSVAFELVPQKPLVIHGRNGLSQKAEGMGKASHYISFTRLAASGSITLQGKRFDLSGSAWMDHEFFTHQLDPEQAGWDWISAQLDNGSELMLFRLRGKNGTMDRYSAGTFVDAAGRGRHLDSSQFTMDPLDTWLSPATGARYPILWRIRVPPLGLDLDCRTPLPQQELVSRRKAGPNYWEGAVTYHGTASGVGYLEMTGYDRPMHLE